MSVKCQTLKKADIQRPLKEKLSIANQFKLKLHLTITINCNCMLKWTSHVTTAKTGAF